MEDLPEPLKELENEDARLASLYSYKLLDTEVEEDLEELNHLAASICETQISLIVLLDKNRQWFKSHYGWDRSETERSFSFCHYTILEEDEIFEVENALFDKRFNKNPLVLGEPNIRYYCGAPLINPEGYRLGSLCVIDRTSRKLSKSQKEAMVVLSKQVVTHFELHKHRLLLENQKKELEKEVDIRTNDLLKINNELKTYLYKASHDIRGPIATILGLSQLGQESTEPEELQFYLKHIHETGFRLDETLQNLLKIMRLKDNKPNISELVAPNIENIVFYVLKNYKNSKVDFVVEVEPTLHFYCDKELFKIIINNLIDNSVKYIDEKKNNSFIRIGVKEEKNNIILTVEDNGEGINQEISHKVYEKFYRGSIRSKGSGLGLYIVKTAVEKLEGKIHFSSIPDKSTTFTVIFKKSL